MYSGKQDTIGKCEYEFQTIKYRRQIDHEKRRPNFIAATLFIVGPASPY